MLTVITGPPCSGKSTYLAQHAQPGELRIDFDDLAQAFGSPVRHGHPDPHRHVTRAARHAAITAAIECHHAGVTVWIVDTAPPAWRRQMYHRNGAQIITLSADPAVLHARADAERPAYWHQLIDQWPG